MLAAIRRSSERSREAGIIKLFAVGPATPANREAIELDGAQYQAVLKSGIPVSLDIDLPSNASAQMVTAVYDWNSNRAGTVEISLRH